MTDQPTTDRLDPTGMSTSARLAAALDDLGDARRERDEAATAYQEKILDLDQRLRQTTRELADAYRIAESAVHERNEARVALRQTNRERDDAIHERDSAYQTAEGIEQMYLAATRDLGNAVHERDAARADKLRHRRNFSATLLHFDHLAAATSMLIDTVRNWHRGDSTGPLDNAAAQALAVIKADPDEYLREILRGERAAQKASTEASSVARVAQDSCTGESLQVGVADVKGHHSKEETVVPRDNDPSIRVIMVSDKLPVSNDDKASDSPVLENVNNYGETVEGDR